jgi:hypothetical protein
VEPSQVVNVRQNMVVEEESVFLVQPHQQRYELALVTNRVDLPSDSLFPSLY